MTTEYRREELDGLIIKDPWIGMVLDNSKSWEIRGSKTEKRGTIYLIRSGSGYIVGQTDIVGCIELTEERFEENKEKHRIETGYEKVPYKSPWAWIFENSIRFQKPIPYIHPRGAVIWVKGL